MKAEPNKANHDKADNDPNAVTSDELFQNCKILAESKNILDELGSELRNVGYVGDIRRPQLTFLTSYTRFGEKPVSLCFKGSTAAGKSTSVELPLRYIPTSAYHKISGMSEKALVRSKVDLEHRHIVVGEFAGLQNRNGNTWLRQLLSEGKLVYDVAVRDGKDWDQKTLEKNGPTGVIFTTTEDQLHPEDETRLISVWIDDGPEQSRDVLLAQSQHIGEKGNEAASDIEKWHCLHDWIAATEAKVRIPFASDLANLVDISSDRIRRDYVQVLSLIKAHALLHQATRERDEDGYIIATLDDYSVVHGLIAEHLDVATGASVPENIVAVVKAVASVTNHNPDYKDGTPQFVIMEKLKLKPANLSTLVKKATNREWLFNKADKGHPKKLVVGDPIPGSRSVLPTPEELAQAVAACKKTHGG